MAIVVRIRGLWTDVSHRDREILQDRLDVVQAQIALLRGDKEQRRHKLLHPLSLAVTVMDLDLCRP